jgi:prepilin-type N-terminal cleavage/methylation domain-containing protein
MSSNLRPLACNRYGFTLIELMTVVVIAGLLAALAIPRFAMASWQTKEKEAELALKHLYTIQNVYQAEAGQFATTVAALQGFGFQPGNLNHYEQFNDSHMPSNACLNPVDADLSGKRIDFDSGRITDC